MKCRYKYCKHNNTVAKEEAIKDGNSYYCKDCFEEKQLKQQIEEYYSVNFPPTTLQILRKVINQLLYTNHYEANYVLYILKKIHINNLKINNPFGLMNYCNEGRYIKEWDQININKEYEKIKNKLISCEDNSQINYTYKKNEKRWTDLI